MNIQELFAEVATAPVVKRAITNHSTLERSVRLRQRLLPRYADRPERAHHPSDLRHREH